jgi:hypothetical protein
LIAHPHRPLLFVEVRDQHNKVVEFSIVDANSGTFLREHIQFEEKWWIQLQDVRMNVVLLKLYAEPSGPEKVSAIAYDFETDQMVWWKNSFLVKSVSGNAVCGDDTTGSEVFLSFTSGEPLSAREVLPLVRNFSVLTPLQYNENSGHFQTMKFFLESKAGLSPVYMVEYLEYRQFVIMSTYADTKGLANFLIVFDSDGNLILKETLGENLKGIGLDTFFIANDRLFFVRNKSELVSYNML